ncbi:excinuclease UvrABC, endonuclease subunit, partial [Serratia symbiotica str. Tucson]
PVAILISCVLI